MGTPAEEYPSVNSPKSLRLAGWRKHMIKPRKFPQSLRREASPFEVDVLEATIRRLDRADVFVSCGGDEEIPRLSDTLRAGSGRDNVEE
jgi:hypothetical protein